MFDITVGKSRLTISIDGARATVHKGRKVREAAIRMAVNRRTVDNLVDAHPCPCGAPAGAGLVSVGLVSNEVSVLCDRCGQRRELGRYTYVSEVQYVS